MKSTKILAFFVIFCISFYDVQAQDDVPNDPAPPVEDAEKPDVAPEEDKTADPPKPAAPKVEDKPKEVVKTEVKEESPDLFKTCFECAALNTKKFCASDIPLTNVNKNAWKGACCDVGDTSISCTPSQHNKCSDTYENSQHMFYSFCPLNNHTMCTDHTSKIFEAQPSPQNFTIDKLKRVNGADNSPVQVDACQYQITVPEHVYESGTIYVRFSKLEQMEVYINAGTGIANASEVLVPENGTVTIYEQYKVDISSGSIIVIAYPKDNQAQTSMELQYWIDGVEAHGLKWWWKTTFHTKEGEMFLGFVVLMLLSCLGVCICAYKSSQSEKQFEEKQARKQRRKSKKDKKNLTKVADFSNVQEKETASRAKEGVNDIELNMTNLPQEPSVDLPPEELALREFKKQVQKCLDIPIEAFFRLCDTNYQREIEVDHFKKMLEVYKIGLSTQNVQRLVQLLDEDLNGKISMKEFYMALDAYDCRDEQGATPLGNVSSGPQQTFEEETVCKMYSVIQSRQISHDELFRMTDVSNDGGIDMSELRDVLLSFGNLQEKEILALQKFMDVDGSGDISEAEFMGQMKKAHHIYSKWKRK